MAIVRLATKMGPYNQWQMFPWQCSTSLRADHRPSWKVIFHHSDDVAAVE